MRCLSKYTFISFAFLAAIVSPLGVKVAYAAGPIEWLMGLLGSAGEGVAYLVAMVIQYLIYIPSAWILRASAFVFDSVVPYSLGVALPGQSAFQSAFITEGWGVMRDITNMVFIFAMLYIAIATILQLGAGRNTRGLLVNIIIIALLVNFSLFLAQVVIDGANLLAYEFYKALTMDNANGLAAVFLSGFNPQQLLNTRSFDDWVRVHEQSNTVLVVLYLFGGVVQLVASYMIFWASFLFIGRIVLLWILMILSPLAFAAYILPNTKKWFDTWWKHLLNQAFVAPIFLFFFFLFALFIQGGLKTFLDESVLQISGAGESAVIESILKVTLGFSLVVAFLVAALKMTKKLGGEAADFATKAAGASIGFAVGGVGGAVLGAGGGKRVAQLASMLPGVGGVVGKTLLGAGERAGRVAGAPLRPLRGAAGEMAVKAGGAVRGAAGEAAKGVVEAGTKQTLGGGILRGVGIARGAAQVEAEARAGAKADIEKAEKDVAGLSDNALRTEYGYAATTAEKRAAIIKVLGERKKLKPQAEGEGPLTRASIKATIETIKGRGYNTEKEIESKYLWQYAEDAKDRAKAALTMSTDAFKEIGKIKEKEGDTQKPSIFFEDDEAFNAFVKNATTAHFTVLADPEVNKDFADNFFNKLSDKIKDARKEEYDKLVATGKLAVGAPFEYFVSDYFKKIGNTRGVQWAKSPLGQGVLDSQNIPYKKEKTKEGPDRGKTGDEEQKKKEKDEKFYQNFFGGEKNNPNS